MPLAGKTLDARWLEFVRQTEPVVEECPEFHAVRQEFFKLQVESSVRVTAGEKLRDLAKLVLRREATSIPAGEADVVFWLDSDREVLVEALLPVRRSVEALGLRTRLVTTAKVAAALNLPAAEVLLLRLPHRYGQMRKWKQAARALRALLPDVLGEDTRGVLLSMGRLADSYVAECERLFAQLRPRLLVLGVDQFMPGSTACVAARRCGMRSLVLLHGAVSPYNAPVTADQMAVWGDYSRRQMEALGVESARLPALGSPRHDRPPHAGDPGARRRFLDAVGGDERLAFTFFSNGNDLKRNSKAAVVGCAEWLAAAAAALKEQVQFLVRLHPNEDGSIYAGMPHLRVFKRECDQAATLAGSDILGGLCSTALLEGLLYGKPVLQFYADGWPDLADNWQQGMAERVASADELRRLLERWVAPVERAGVVQRQQQQRCRAFANWGGAAEAIAQHVQRLCAR